MFVKGHREVKLQSLNEIKPKPKFSAGTINLPGPVFLLLY